MNLALGGQGKEAEHFCLSTTSSSCLHAGLGVLAGAADEDIDEFEIDLNDAEPSFLKGVGSKSGIEMSPIKIVKNPDGTMQRSAMTQVSLWQEKVLGHWAGPLA